jgi:hypothetical protein
MTGTTKGMKYCLGCKKLFLKQKLFTGKWNWLFCSKCIQKKENKSSKQNGSLQIKYILNKMVSDVND